MATPKKKISKSRRNMRRFAGGNRLDKVSTTNCPSCNEPSRPHCVCRCGHYNGKKVMAGRNKTKEAQA